MGASALDVRAHVDAALRSFLERQRSRLLGVDTDLLPAVDALDDLLAGGKRLRAAFCYWGWRGAGGEDRPEIIIAAAALELFHGGALIHDDLIDASETRRGLPSLHQRFAARHAEARWRGAAERYGTSVAIILGDLCLAWADEMYHGSGLAPAALLRGQDVLDLMRGELIAGQYLDLLAQARGDSAVEAALRVVRFKSAKYTVERPLHLGGALAGAGEELAAVYTAYGMPLGVAFQLRDDVLGVFGDPAVTGKPAGDDLRQGKQTVLVALALLRADPVEEKLARRLLGDPRLGPAGVDRLREMIHDTGALAECESMIERFVEEALAALDDSPLDRRTRRALTDLATAATVRTS